MRERGSDKTKHAVVGACRPFSDVQEKEVYTVPGSKII